MQFMNTRQVGMSTCGFVQVGWLQEGISDHAGLGCAITKGSRANACWGSGVRCILIKGAACGRRQAPLATTRAWDS